MNCKRARHFLLPIPDTFRFISTQSLSRVSSPTSRPVLDRIPTAGVSRSTVTRSRVCNLHIRFIIFFLLVFFFLRNSFDSFRHVGVCLESAELFRYAKSFLHATINQCSMSVNQFPKQQEARISTSLPSYYHHFFFFFFFFSISFSIHL